MTSETEQLKPCPFCGSPHVEVWMGHRVTCGKCDCEGPSQSEEVAANVVNMTEEDVPESKWRPIAEAPKDKYLLLATEFDGPNDWRIKGGYFSSKTQEWEVHQASWEPTMYQELPQPPTVSVPKPKAPNVKVEYDNVRTSQDAEVVLDLHTAYSKFHVELDGKENDQHTRNKLNQRFSDVMEKHRDRLPYVTFVYGINCSSENNPDSKLPISVTIRWKRGRDHETDWAVVSFTAKPNQDEEEA